jgi:SAM-dependent methyltransferase
MASTISDTLRAVLACPRDGASLSSSADGVRCEHGHQFPFVSGLPRITPEDATQTGTAESFGAKWVDKYRDEDRPALDSFQYQWYLERYGFPDEAALADFLAPKQLILDAGCGVGRDVDRYARLSAGQVVGFDLSRAVVRAHQLYGGEGRHFLFGDIMAPPFRPRTFDFVVADQVIHHTPDTASAFARLAALVADGGEMAVYVYRRKSLLRELADTHIREVTTQLTVDEALEFSEQVTELGRELSRVEASITLEHGIPLLGIPAGEHDVQRLIYWHFLKCFWNDDFGQDLSVLTNLDWYHPPYASRHTPEELESWCQAAGMSVVHLDVGESGISIRARRP